MSWTPSGRPRVDEASGWEGGVAASSKPVRDAREAGSDLRILLLYDCIYPESVGGVEHRNYELAQALAARGHEIVLAGMAADAPDISPGVHVVPLAKRRSLYTRKGRRSIREALRYANAVRDLDVGRFDVVETANIPYIHLWPVAHQCDRAGVPLLVTWHEYWGKYWRRYLGPIRWVPFALIERLSVWKGTVAAAVSALTADRVAEHRSDPVPVVPNGVSIAKIRRAVGGGEVAKNADLVYAGRLQKEKRLDVALEAVAQLSATGMTVTMDLVGDGPDRPRLERLASQLAIGDAVRFHGRLPEARAVWRAIASARVALQPSEREGFGMFPLEAMACGIPVIYCRSRESAVSELVRHGLEGFECEPTAAALAAAITELLDDTEHRQRLSTNAKLRARRYNWAHIAERFEQLCTRLKDGTEGRAS